MALTDFLLNHIKLKSVSLKRDPKISAVANMDKFSNCILVRIGTKKDNPLMTISYLPSQGFFIEYNRIVLGRFFVNYPTRFDKKSPVKNCFGQVFFPCFFNHLITICYVPSPGSY